MNKAFRVMHVSHLAYWINTWGIDLKAKGRLFT